MFKPKMLIIASSIGFALSLLIGLSSGVALASTLLRAFISGMGCALIVIGVSFVFQKFLPEINDVLQGTTNNTDEQTGSVVNVVIDDDNASLQDDLDSSLYIPLPTDSNSLQQKSAVSGSKYKKQSEYNVAQSQKSESDEYADPQDAIVDEDEGNYEYNESSDTAASKSKSANNSSSLGLDTLPDISAFVSDSVSDSELKQGVGVSGESDTDISAIATKSGPDVDTKNMAHAIRTMLAREK